jgi:hypothetical protein
MISVFSDSKEAPMTQQYVREEYPLSEVTSRIIKAGKEVHKELGPGFEEVIYQRSLAREFPAHDLDFVQTLSYLKASGYKVALLLNFGAKRLGIKRIVYEKARM